MTATPIAIAVHGGAWAMPDELVASCGEGCRGALAAGLSVLRSGGSSLDAVQAAVAVLEDEPVFDAGYGSFLNADGSVECDAGMMDGSDLRVGAIAAVSGVRNPVLLARQVLESPYAFLVGPGARTFAEQAGVPLCDPAELITPEELARWHELAGVSQDNIIERGLFGDTVGAVAVDRRGHVAAATSTGGTPNKPLGRVGDSPLIGTGVFADNASAAVSTTGHGERIIPLVWARSVADMVAAGVPPADAARRAPGLLCRTDARGGLILVSPDGRVGVGFNTPRMAYASYEERTDRLQVGPEPPAADDGEDA